MATHIAWVAIAAALLLPFPSLNSADDTHVVPGGAPVEYVVKAEGLRAHVEGWADGKPQPLLENGMEKEWNWYRLTIEGGPQTYTFYTPLNPYVSDSTQVSLVEQNGKDWLLLKLSLAEDSDMPHVYCPVELTGTPCSMVRRAGHEDIWCLKPVQKLFDWEISAESRKAGRSLVDELVNGKPQRLQYKEREEDESPTFRGTIQHEGKTYSFYLYDTEPMSGRFVKVTREVFDGQDCFHLSSLIDEIPYDQYLPIKLAGRYGQFRPSGKDLNVCVMKSLDAILEEDYGLLNTNKP